MSLSKSNAEVRKKSNKSYTEYTLIKKIIMSRELYLLMIPFFVLFFIFTLMPVLLSVFLGFTNYNLLQVPQFVGFENYIRMFLQDDIFLIAIKNTFIFAFITGPIGYILSFMLAWFINDLNKNMRTFATTIFYAPAISGQVYTVWLFLFSPDAYGIINSTLMQMGILKEPIAWLVDPAYNVNVLIIVQLWLSMGTGFLAFIAGLQSVDRSLFEAGYIDGIANRMQELWYITLPSMQPQLVFGAVMQIIASFAVAEISIRLAGFPSTGYSAETMVTHIMDHGTIRFEMGYACAMATILVLIMLITNKGVGNLLKKIGK